MRLLGGLLVTVALTVTACGTDDASGCIELREALDPLFTQHVLDADELSYLTDPPTSGPHLAGPLVEGVLDAPIIAPAQVRMLEAGGVVVQYEDGVDVAALASLVERSEVPVVVAPAESLPSPVVATAWTWKLTCGEPDVERILRFTERTDAAPGLD